jgi:hypothetical protein
MVALVIFFFFFFVNFFSYFKKMVFCSCQECRALNIEAGGREVGTVTKWRHNKKENEWYTYLDNFDSMFSTNEPLNNQETEV